jgi:hypothetical protein
VRQQAKKERVLYSRLLQPLPISKGIWKNIIMDLVEGLPKLRGKNTISVIVDRFTKYRYFLAVAHPFTA